MVVLLYRWQTRRRWSTRAIVSHLVLLLFPTLGSRHDLVSACLICRVVEQRSNVVHEQRVQHLGDFFFVGKIQCSLEGDPDALQMHRPYLYHMAHLFALQNSISSTTRHSSHIEKLGAIDHVVVFSACHADTSGLNLETQATLIFPQSCRNPRLHTVRRYLPCGIHSLILVRHA